MPAIIDYPPTQVAPSTRVAGGHPPRPTTHLRPYDYASVTTVLAALILWVITGVPLTPIRPWFGAYLMQVSLFLFAGVSVLFGFRFTAHIGRYRRINGRYLRGLITRHFGLNTAWIAMRYVFSFVVVMTVHTSIKQAIPLINRAQYDVELIEIERLVHLGFNPAWDLTALDTPAWWPIVLDACYYLWFPFMPLVAAYFLTHRNRRKREHYFASFMGIWLVGVLLGLAFPSHGPCYVDVSRFPSDGMVICQMVQNRLWEDYTALQEITLQGNGGLRFASGLMAMPSLHVTVCCLYVIFLWREGRWWRWASLTYALLIFLGSLYSGWHYAIDGYAGLVIAALVVWCTAKLPDGALRKRHNHIAEVTPYLGRR